jgi:hypothetical protein
LNSIVYGCNIFGDNNSFLKAKVDAEVGKGHHKDGNEVLEGERKKAVIHAAMEIRKCGPNFNTIINFVVKVKHAERIFFEGLENVQRQCTKKCN